MRPLSSLVVSALRWIALLAGFTAPAIAADRLVDPTQVQSLIAGFNRWDKETIVNAIDNRHAGAWVEKNVPGFDCPDPDIEQIYYFRWWVYRKHLVRTPSGWVVTEFLPAVGHAGSYNTIVMASGLHVEEGRWLRDPQYISSYCRFWYAPANDANRLKYSNWLSDAGWEYCQTTGDWKLAAELLPRWVYDYRAWEAKSLHASGLFWTPDNRDGEEYSISGNGLKPSLNSYLYGDAIAIAACAQRFGQAGIAAEFRAKAERLRRLVEEKLWDPAAGFFKTFPLDRRGDPVARWDFASVPADRNVRELFGFTPWKFGLTEGDPRFDGAWRQATDPRGFAAPSGLTTAERRHPRFMRYRVKRCQWDGAVWPFATSIALRGMANELRAAADGPLSKSDYLAALRTYASSQHRTLPYGDRIPWIGEDIHPDTGIWLAQAVAFELDDPVVKRDLFQAFERGKDYNHSSFCDLVIADLIGLRSRDDATIEVDPLLPEGAWNWFCLENVHYQGRNVTIVYDRDGTHYHRGRGLSLLVDGRRLAHADRLDRLTATPTGPSS